MSLNFFPVAWVGSLGIALIFFTGPLTGIVINRLGCRTTSSVGAVTCAVRLVLTSFSNSIFVMYFSYSVLLGVGTSLVFASALVINAKYFDKRRAFATGILGAGWALGLMWLAPILQTLLSAFGWRHTYRIMSAVVFVICLLGCFYKPLVDNERDAATSIEGDPNLTQDTEREALLQKETANHQLLDIGVWKNPAFVKITLLAAVVQFGRYSPLLHQVILSSSQHGISDTVESQFLEQSISQIKSPDIPIQISFSSDLLHCPSRRFLEPSICRTNIRFSWRFEKSGFHFTLLFVAKRFY